MIASDNRYTGIYRCRDKKILIGKKTLVMGILNCTPDSFSDGGRFTDVESCMRQADLLVSSGCDVIDIGGEATNPKVQPITAEEEISRIIPVIRAIREKYGIPLSVDTYKAKTAAAALEAGCDIVNDITGLFGDPDMAKTAASYKAGVIVMFNSRIFGAAENKPEQDILARAEEEISKSIKIAADAGIEAEYIMTDPGIGFGTNRQQDGALTEGLIRFGFDGKYPILYAASRKRYVKALSGKDDVTEEELDRITAGLSVTAAAAGAAMVRVHDAAGSRQALNAFDSVFYGG
ncbi:MAG: dihydropteroate synthase [Clostridiales bacterium]|nr:dihydropteroate synthase [Clostridiales bacterium]